MLNRYAVMGQPIAHSLSPIIHQLFSQQTGRPLSYEKIEIDLSRFEQQVHDFFKQGGCGLNITLPCKQRAFAMSEQSSERCIKAGAANTLWMQAGKLHADNTDGVGLLRDLGRHIALENKAILLLGAGGAARGIIGPLLDAHPAKLIIANRSLEKANELQQIFPQTQICRLDDLAEQPEKQAYDLVINATSASLEGEGLRLPDWIMATKPLCYDLAYRKDGLTPFVVWGRSQNCIALDGLGMLVEQAAEAFFIWHSLRPDTRTVLEHLRKKCMYSSS